MYAYKDIFEVVGLSSQLYTLFATQHALRPLPKFVCSAPRVALPRVSVEVPGGDC